MKLGVGLYGSNGHQIHAQLLDNPRARLAAFAGIDDVGLISNLAETGAVRYDVLQNLLEDPAISLVSLCSPRRSDQAKDAILAMSRGKHVLAEKPAAMSLPDLLEIKATAERTGMFFFEMGAFSLGQPELAIRKLIERGAIGTVVQFVARKSYPWHAGRPQDEAMDGGLIEQCAIYGARWAEHAALCHITHVSAIETTLGNPAAGGGLRMAACLSMNFAGGGIGTVYANYLNPIGKQVWGYDAMRVFGTDGMIEWSAEGFSRFVSRDKDYGSLDLSESAPNQLEIVLDAILDGRPAMFGLDEQLHPTKVVICAKASAERGAVPIAVEA